ncbi:MAG: hypothetical protein NTW65_11330 [Deltaproteobacteria bacterium]|nr:hypothetical protein [Deltaproteobacteria bacterium]
MLKAHFISVAFQMEKGLLMARIGDNIVKIPFAVWRIGTGGKGLTVEHQSCGHNKQRHYDQGNGRMSFAKIHLLVSFFNILFSAIFKFGLNHLSY